MSICASLPRLPIWILWFAPMLLLTVRGQQPNAVHVSISGPVRIDYCENDSDLALATIHVTAVLENRGDSNLIVSRELGPDVDVRVVDELGRTVYSPHPSYYETTDHKFTDKPDDKMFEIVKPGSKVERDFVVGIPVSKNPGHPVSGALPPGAYRVWATRSSWPFYGDETRAELVRRTWSRYGSLVLTTIKVDGIKAQLRLVPKLDACQTSGTNN